MRLCVFLLLVGLLTSTTALAQTYPLSSQVPTLSGGAMALGTATPQALIDARSATAGISTTGIAIGTAAYTDTGILGQFTSGQAGYNQVIIQNTSAAANASSNLVVGNNLSTASGFYGEFGMNSSTFTGTGAPSAANAVYLDSASSDLAIGTLAANKIHFFVNSGATDAVTIGSTGSVTIGNASARAGQIACFTTGGQMGYCSSGSAIGGGCTCNGI